MSQEREYREVLEAFNEKSKEKAQLVAKLMEVKSLFIIAIDFLFDSS